MSKFLLMWCKCTLKIIYSWRATHAIHRSVGFSENSKRFASHSRVHFISCLTTKNVFVNHRSYLSRIRRLYHNNKTNKKRSYWTTRALPESEKKTASDSNAMKKYYQHRLLMWRQDNFTKRTPPFPLENLHVLISTPMDSLHI